LSWHFSKIGGVRNTKTASRHSDEGYIVTSHEADAGGGFRHGYCITDCCCCCVCFVLRCAGWVATPSCVFVMLWSLGVSCACLRVCRRLLLPSEADVEHCFHHCMDIDGIAMVMRSELMDRESLRYEDRRSHESRQKGTRHRHLHRAAR
jgi:hypothetical protein